MLLNTLDQDAAARNGQGRSLMAKFGAATAFFDPELMQIGFPRLRQWIKDEPRLAFFAHYVDRLEKRQAHVRSGEVEQVLAMVNDPFFAATGIYNALNNAELTFQPAQGLGWHPARGRSGQHRCPDHPPRPGSAPHRLGELFRWLSQL